MLDIVSGKDIQRIVKRPYLKDIDVIRARLIIDGYEILSYFQGPHPYNTSLFFVPPKVKVASLLTSRGCPYSCTFCHNSWKGLPFRQNSAQRVIDDIQYLVSTYKIDALFFCDDNLFADKIRLKIFAP